MNTILLILIILLSLRLIFQWIVPLVFPYVLKRFIKKHGQNFGGFTPPEENKTTATPKFNETKPAAKSNDDDYIDFEEVQ